MQNDGASRRSKPPSRGAASSMGKMTSRRAILKGAALSAAAVAAPAVVRAQGKPQGFNILFVFSDQERYFRRLPLGYSLPGHERLANSGVTFHNHYCPAVMCTSSRSVLLTGLQTADTGMFDNTNPPWQPDMSTELPTYGDMLEMGGVYPAYKGKFHLSRKFDTGKIQGLFTEEMEQYGFRDYQGVGDIVGHELGGYENDHLIASNAIRWLRHTGQELNESGQAWSLTVSLVNPHDIMYFNTDLEGEQVQDTGKLMMHTERAPNHALYRSSWDIRLPESLQEPFDKPGRPAAHGEFNNMWGHLLGNIPQQEERWARFNDYYLNCLRHADMQLVRLLDELNALGLGDRTIVIYTSDHGETAGAHGLRGKGPFVYEECIHLPLTIAHPDIDGAQDCWAITGHIDIAPTILSLGGLSKAQIGDAAGRDLPGHDLSSVLQDPGNAAVDAVREGALFTYSGLMTVDSEWIGRIAEAAAQGKSAKSLVEQGVKPDLTKRGNVRAVFDGRHKFARYFGPLERNEPGTLNDLYANNDVELFDLESDPDETVNLAAERGGADALTEEMNAKLNRLMAAEFGADDGREMPDIEGITWQVDRIDI